MAANRDWQRNPPKTLEEGFQFAEHLAQQTFDEIERHFGERPHTERRDNTVIVVWPDGEITNQIEVSYVQ